MGGRGWPEGREESGSRCTSERACERRGKDRCRGGTFAEPLGVGSLEWAAESAGVTAVS